MSSYHSICRMCHRETGKLVSPCACQGSMKFVHSRCLTQWVARHGNLKCEVCGATYSVAKIVKDGKSNSQQKNYFLLLCLCIKRYIRRNASVFLNFVLCLVTFFLVPFVLGFFQRAVNPLLSSEFSWLYAASLFDVDAEWTLVSTMDLGMRLSLIVFPLFFFSEVWCDWLASHELNLFSDDALETAGTATTQSLDAVESEEEFEAEDAAQENQKLLPVSSPEEDGSVLEAITAAQLQSNRAMGVPQRKASFTILLSGIRFVFFYVFLVVSLGIFPEVVHFLLRGLWGSLSGRGGGAAAARRLLLRTSLSGGAALRRLSALRELAGALAASPMRAVVYFHVRAALALAIAASVAKRKCVMARCRRLLFTVVHLRGLLNFFMLLCYVLPAVTLLTTFVCLDFFESEALVDVEDSQQRAWSILRKSSNKNSFQSYGNSEVSSPVLVLKALHILSKSNDEDICWKFSESFYNMSCMVVDDTDDVLLFPIFALTKLFSELDGLILSALSYVEILFGFFVYYQILTLAAKLPLKWIERSVLCRFLHFGFLHMIALLDGRTFFTLLSEILVLTCVVSVFLARYALAIVAYMDPSLVPIPRLLNANRWLRVLYFVNPAPVEGFLTNEILRALHGRLFETISAIFDVHVVQQAREERSLPHVLSLAIRWVAFILFYWVSSFCFMSGYMIVVLYMVSKRFALMRTLLFILLNVYTCIRVAFPQAFFFTQARLNAFIARVHMFICMCKCQWWIRSSLALSVNGKTELGERSARLFNVEPLTYLPKEVQRSSFYAVHRLYERVGKKLGNKSGVNVPSLERIKKMLYLHLTHYSTNDALLEEDVFLLADLVECPTALQLINFLTTCCLLGVFLPFVAGSAFIAWIRNSVFSTPLCYTGPLLPLFCFMWICGVVLTVLSLSFKGSKTNMYARVKTFFYCGCHHFSTKKTLMNCIIPVFLRVGFFTFVPYSLSTVTNAFVPTLTASLGFFFFSMGVFSALPWKRDHVVRMSMFAWDFYKKRELARIQNQVLQAERASRDDIHLSHTVDSERDEANRAAFTLSDGDEHTRINAQNVVYSILIFVVGLVEWCRENLLMLKATFFYFEESSRKILINIAERENVNGVVFVNRGH